MKCALVIPLAALLLAVNGAELPEFVRGTPVVSITARSGTCSAPNILECNGCSSMKVCSSDSSVAAIIPCSEPTPYCTNNRCSATPDPNGCANNVLCPKANSFFPNPSNCQLYHYCDAKKMLIQYQCPPNYIYNHATTWCRLRSTTNPCTQISCNVSTNYGNLYAYPADPSLYIYCDGVQKRTILFACDAGEEFDAARTKSCVFACKEEGQFPFKDDCSKYNACYLTTSNNYLKIESQCPTGMKFHPIKRVCDISLKECYVAPPVPANPKA